jgi:hypothetical protein
MVYGVTYTFHYFKNSAIWQEAKGKCQQKTVFQIEYPLSNQFWIITFHFLISSMGSSSICFSNHLSLPSCGHISQDYSVAGWLYLSYCLSLSVPHYCRLSLKLCWRFSCELNHPCLSGWRDLPLLLPRWSDNFTMLKICVWIQLRPWQMSYMGEAEKRSRSTYSRIMNVQNQRSVMNLNVPGERGFRPDFFESRIRIGRRFSWREGDDTEHDFMSPVLKNSKSVTPCHRKIYYWPCQEPMLKNTRVSRKSTLRRRPWSLSSIWMNWAPLTEGSESDENDRSYWGWQGRWISLRVPLPLW